MIGNFQSGVRDAVEGRFRLLVESVQDYAIYLMDRTGHIMTWNPGAQRCKGYTADEILLQHFRCFFLPEDRERQLPEQLLQQTFETGHFEGEGWRIRKDGSPFWASVVITVVQDEAGRVTGFAKVTRDLTERKLREVKLRASEAALHAEMDRLRHTLHAIADGIVCTDTMGTITLLNPAAELCTGWTHEDALGRPVESVVQLVDEKSGQSVSLPMQECLTQSNAYFSRKDLKIVSRSGVGRSVQDSVAPICDATGEIIGTVLVLH